MQDEDATAVVDELHILNRLPGLTELVFFDGDGSFDNWDGMIVDGVYLMIVPEIAAVRYRLGNNFAALVDKGQARIVRGSGNHGRDHADATRFDQIVADIGTQIVWDI